MMTTYDINDTVRIVARSPWFDLTGRVIDAAANQFRVDVDGGPAWFGPHELVRAEWAGAEE